MNNQIPLDMIPIKHQPRNACHCSRTKNPHVEFCDFCYGSLSVMLRLDLFHGPGIEQERAVRRALVHLHGGCFR